MCFQHKIKQTEAIVKRAASYLKQMVMKAMHLLRYAPIKYGLTLSVSHWLGANLEPALLCNMRQSYSLHYVKKNSGQKFRNNEICFQVIEAIDFFNKQQLLVNHIIIFSLHQQNITHLIVFRMQIFFNSDRQKIFHCKVVTATAYNCS